MRFLTVVLRTFDQESKIDRSLSPNPNSNHVTVASSLHLVTAVPLSLKQFTQEQGENCCGVVESTYGSQPPARVVGKQRCPCPGVANLAHTALESRKAFAYVLNQGRS